MNAAVNITRVKTWSEHLSLSRPYTIAYKSVQSAKVVFVYLETDDGQWGVGAGSPAEFVTGESFEACRAVLEERAEALLLGKDVRQIHSLCRHLEAELNGTPAAQTALDVALHDLFARYLDMPLVDFLGRVHHALPTSITIGIKSLIETLAEADEYLGRGFRIIKLKVGKSVEEDLEIVRKLRERVGREIRIRVDANQGYSSVDLLRFARETASLELELIEQPLSRRGVDDMLKVPPDIRAQCAADESLISPADALFLAAEPPRFGIYNIKLMKCGGIYPAMCIANIARLAGIRVMWGCMDESIISISAALHAAFASPATAFLDLDGSFDLARDLVTGGFNLKDGILSVKEQPGLGIQKTEAMIEKTE